MLNGDAEKIKTMESRLVHLKGKDREKAEAELQQFKRQCWAEPRKTKTKN